MKDEAEIQPSELVPPQLMALVGYHMEGDK
jgi:hypothetical protein